MARTCACAVVDDDGQRAGRAARADARRARRRRRRDRRARRAAPPAVPGRDRGRRRARPGSSTATGAVQYAPNIPGLRRSPLRADLQRRARRPRRRRQRRQRGGLGRGRARRGQGHALLARDHARDRRSAAASSPAAASSAARTGSRPRSATSRSSPTAQLCACGERGHWEAYASGNALGRMGREWAAGGEGAARARTRRRRRRRGHRASTSVTRPRPASPTGWRSWASTPSTSRSAWPASPTSSTRSCIVISGGLVELGETLFAPVRRAFEGRVEGPQYRPAIGIVPAVLGEQAGVIGAAARARELEPGSVGNVGAMKLGLTLPSFQRDPEVPIAVARAADAAGVDGVFALRPPVPVRARRQPPARARRSVAARRGGGRDDVDRARHARRPGDAAAAGHARRHPRHPRPHRPRSPPGRDRQRRLREQGGERELRARVRVDARPRRSPSAPPCSRSATGATRCGWAGRRRWCARWRRGRPTGGTAGVGRRTASPARRRRCGPTRSRSPFTLSWGGLVGHRRDRAPTPGPSTSASAPGPT